ncbi:hypothetical protein [Duganella vulcania]|nr:hypothetical protein [Duganella vulcania]
MNNQPTAAWNIRHAYIDGAFVPVHGERVVESVNPATGQARRPC